MQISALHASGPGSVLGGAVVAVAVAAAAGASESNAFAWLRTAAAAVASIVGIAAVAQMLQRSAVNWGAGAGHSRWALASVMLAVCFHLHWQPQH